MDLKQLEKEWSKGDIGQGELQAKIWDRKQSSIRKNQFKSRKSFLKQIYEECR